MKNPSGKEIIYFHEWKKYGVEAGVTTKSFGVFIQKADDLNLAYTKKKLARALLPGGHFVYLQQVHGGRVGVLQSKHQGFQRLKQTDGVITNVPGLTLLALTADCLSIYFMAPGWVGVVHAGWRGTRQKIAQTAVKLLMKKSKCAPSELRVIFGPSICGKHYEVGEEFKKYFSKSSLTMRKGKYYLDLIQENRRQILRERVLLKNISNTTLCTISQNKSFYSFRKEKDAAGRMISFIRLDA